MREILFRGKQIDNGEWVEGDLLRTKFYLDDSEHSLIFTDSVEFPRSEFGGANEVIPETLGQYTGLTDKNGKRIFEGDIIHIRIGNYEKHGIVMYAGERSAQFGIIEMTGNWNFSFLHRLAVRQYAIVVIGNIHDNPELMEG